MIKKDLNARGVLRKLPPLRKLPRAADCEMLALLLSAPAFFGFARPLAAGPARPAASLRSAGPRLSYESAAEDKKAAEALEQANKMVDSFVDMLGDLPPPPSLMALKDAVGVGELAAVRIAQYVLLYSFAYPVGYVID